MAHLRKRGNSWTAVVSLGRGPNGRKRQQWVSAATKAEAKRKAAAIENAVAKGGYSKPSGMAVATFLRQWLRDYASPAVRARTLQGYTAIVERRLIPELGNIPLAQLQPGHLQAFYAELLKNGRRDGKGGLSARTVGHHHRVLREALGHGVKWGLLGRNVADSLDPPKPKKVEMRALDATGIRHLLKAAEGTVYHDPILLALHTGLRRSELLALRWQDIDLNMATLSVSRAYQRLLGGLDVFEPPKSGTGRRQVALPPTAILNLRAHRERQEADAALFGSSLRPDTRVFTWEDGRPILPLTFSHAF